MLAVADRANLHADRLFQSGQQFLRRLLGSMEETELEHAVDLRVLGDGKDDQIPQIAAAEA